MLFRTFPPDERVRASSILTVPTAVAPAIGPVLGGLLVTNLSWRWVFFVNLPIGIAAFAFGLVFLEEHRQPHPGRFDAPRLPAVRVSGSPRSCSGSARVPTGAGAAPRSSAASAVGAGAARLDGGRRAPDQPTAAQAAPLRQPAVPVHQPGAHDRHGRLFGRAVRRAPVLPDRPRASPPCSPGSTPSPRRSA